MLKERIDLLESIGFIWDFQGDAWEQSFEKLKDFYRDHGHCRVPIKHNNGKLTNWLKKQSKAYRALIDNESSAMTKERIVKLRSLGIQLGNRRECYVISEKAVNAAVHSFIVPYHRGKEKGG